MVPAVLYRVCYGSSHPPPWQVQGLRIRPAILQDWCRRRVLNCDYPAIINSIDSSVRGTVVTGLTDADIWRLDIFEGSGYKRVKVHVLPLAADEKDSVGKNAHAAQVQVETYVWIGDKADLEEKEWDFAEFKRDKLRSWVTSGQEYEGSSAASHTR